MTTNGKAKPRAYSLTDPYYEIIKAHAAAIGANDSAALRDIIDEWMIFCELDTDASNAGGDQVPA